MHAADFFEREALSNGGTLTRAGTWHCLHRWTTDEIVGAYRYRACGKCGRRKVTQIKLGMYGGPDWGWLDTGVRSPPPRPMTHDELLRNASLGLPPATPPPFETETYPGFF